jgi:hypothetical protein
MSDGPSISIGSITGGQNNIGKTEIAGDQVQNNHYGSQPATLDRVLDAVVGAIPAESHDELMASVINPIKDELDAVASLPADDQPAHQTTLVERVTSLAENLRPYAPAVCKALVAMGEASLVAIAPPAGWVVGALVAAVKAMNDGTHQN